MCAKKCKRSLIFLSVLIALIIVLSACGAPAAEEPVVPEPPAPPEEPAEEPAPEEPEEPIRPEDQFPVQYGLDSRTELFLHPDQHLRDMAASVAILVHRNQVKISDNSVNLNGYTLNQLSESGWLVKDIGAPMCAGELFSEQVAPGFCTGFLVENDLLVTAGHCFDNIPCVDTNVVFGFQMESPNSLATIAPDDVYLCKEIIALQVPDYESGGQDYAIVKLGRSTGRAGLAYNAESNLSEGDLVAVIGHPSGIPMKIASNAVVLSNEGDLPYFVTNLDAFGSNSGSPVINMDTYQVEGILVRGMADYVLAPDDSCIQVNRCPEDGGEICTGESATKMSAIDQAVQENEATRPNPYFCISDFCWP